MPIQTPVWVSKAASPPTDRTDKNFGFAKAIAPESLKEYSVFISAAHKKLNAAIQIATDPAEIAQLTTALSRLMDAEGRERGRRYRQKARAEKATKKQPPPFDLDTPFELDA